MPTAVIGNVKDILGVATPSGVQVRLSLKWTGGGVPRVNGVALLFPDSNGSDRCSSPMTVNPSTGAITGTVYSTRDAAGTGNGEIEVNGSLIAVYYEVQLIKNGKTVFSFPVHAKNGVSLDLTSVTPITVPPVVSAPTGDTTYAQLSGGNMPFTGQVVGKNGTVGSPSFAFASSLATGFWRQAADVIGVSIAGALKWLWNAAGILFGSAGAIAWSSNSDPSAAGGDSWLTRIGAAILAIGSTNGGTNGELRLAKVNKITITQPANGSTLTLTDGITLTAPVTGTAATGTGTTNKVPKFTTGANGVIGDSSITDNGTAVSSSLPFTLTPNKQIFTSTGSSTFTIPAGVTAVKVTLVGAGGAGGGGTATANTGGPGGGSGAMAVKWLTGLTPGNTISTSVGTGGTGVSGGSGNAGGNTTISSGTQSITTVTAGGGGGGTGGAAGGAFGGGGGSATNGDLNFSGNEGQFMIGNTNTGQNGTASPFAGGAPRGASAGANNGNSGNSVGAGGSGGGGGTGNTTGGAGANGLIVFEWIS